MLEAATVPSKHQYTAEIGLKNPNPNIRLVILPALEPQACCQDACVKAQASPALRGIFLSAGLFQQDATERHRVEHQRHNDHIEPDLAEEDNSKEVVGRAHGLPRSQTRASL